MNETAAEMIDFWAAWCSPCKVMEPILDELTEKFSGKVTVTKINVDDDANQAIVQTHAVMSIPTYIFLKNGAVVDRAVGAQSKEAMIKKLDALLA